LLDPPTAYVEQSPNALINTPLFTHGVPATVGADVTRVGAEVTRVGAEVTRVGAVVGANVVPAEQEPAHSLHWQHTWLTGVPVEKSRDIPQFISLMLPLANDVQSMPMPSSNTPPRLHAGMLVGAGLVGAAVG
jgi:hypothetical protein